MLVLLVSIVASFILPGTAAAEDLVVVRVTADDGAEDLRRGPVQARVGESVTLRVVVVGHGGRLSPVAPGTRVRWFRVVPRMQHVETAPPNEGVDQYSNSVLFGPRHGRWLGYDAIEYDTVELGGHEGQLTVDRVTGVSAAGGENGEAPFGGAGSAWYAATAEALAGTAHRTPGGEDVDRLGLSRAVMRVSFRTGDDYLGWLSTYFHVPNVFGSTGPQADRYVGADCADVLVGARRASGGRQVRYTSVGGIASVARPVSSVLLLGEDGRVRDESGRAMALRWNDDIEAGDLFAIDYTTAGAQLPRPWDHIGALLGDTNGDGLLGGADALRHMTPRGLLDRPLSNEGPIRFRVWRLRD
ncbi:MAG: hypothetical protein DRJ42_06215 [Deltaproteobacteria bacterium]|nr:MAG: hypothetical protein DRJ42_06215 [Deltaproteobacteria bacterium]